MQDFISSTKQPKKRPPFLIPNNWSLLKRLGRKRRRNNKKRSGTRKIPRTRPPESIKQKLITRKRIKKRGM